MINKIGEQSNILLHNAGKKENKVPTFADTLKEYITGVNNDQIAAKESVNKLLRGETNDIHSTVISVEKAEISLQLMLQLRNKVIQSYQDIMRIQV